MAPLRASWRTSLPVVQQPRNPQSESIARTPYHRGNFAYTNPWVHMRVAHLALAAGLLSTGTLAQPRPSTTDMRCAQAAGIVAARGAIVLGTGGFTYDRFVSDASHLCDQAEDRAGLGARRRYAAVLRGVPLQRSL